MAGIVEKARRQSRQDAQQDEVEMQPNENQDSKRIDTADNQHVNPNNNREGQITKFETVMDEAESTEMKVLTADEDQEVTEDFTLQIPQVEDDQWPEEDQYTKNDQGQYLNNDDVDTLF